MTPRALLAKALLAYSVHEHQLGHVRRVEVWLAPERLTVHDDGRGMGLDRNGYVEGLLGTLVGRSAEVQLHGIGLSMVAALTPRLEVESQRNGSAWKQSFELGIARGAPLQAPCGSETGTRITLTGLPPLAEADVASLVAQCEVWRAANPALTIVIHDSSSSPSAHRVAYPLHRADVPKAASRPGPAAHVKR